MTPEEARLVIAHGARLDAWAAAVSRFLGRRLLDWQDVLEEHRQDEIRHAEMLKGLEAPDVSAAYAWAVGMSALGQSTEWNAVVLNLVERRSVIQFHVAARVLPRAEARILRQIAREETRHVRHGEDILRALKPSASLVAEAGWALTEWDQEHLGLARQTRRKLAALNNHCVHEIIRVLP